ncbi:MAG: hypothetical protein ACU0BF_02025 [Paracoccaceae bacterium]
MDDIRPRPRPETLGRYQPDTAATQRDVLPLDEYALLGVVERGGRVHAMIRSPQGLIETVREGDLCEAGRVVSLSNRRMVLRRDGRDEVLTFAMQ